MNRKILLLNLCLLALLASLGWMLRVRWLEARAKERAASEVPIAEVVANYLAVKGETVSRPKELAQRMDAILDWWGDKTLDDVSKTTCKLYAQSRSTATQARRERSQAGRTNAGFRAPETSKPRSE